MAQALTGLSHRHNSGVWQTRRPMKTVLAVVHNVTAASRLTDVLSVLSGDPRIQIDFSVIGSSAFTAGTHAFLEKLEVTIIPWLEAASADYNLAVAASHGGPLSALNFPLAMFPHGMGYNKYLISDQRSAISDQRSAISDQRSAAGLRIVGAVVDAGRCRDT